MARTARRRGKTGTRKSVFKSKVPGGAPKLAPGWSPGDRWGPGENDVMPGGPPKGRVATSRGKVRPADGSSSGIRGRGGTPVGRTSTGRTSPSGGTLGQGRAVKGVPTKTGPVGATPNPSRPTSPGAGSSPRKGPSARGVIASGGRAGGTIRGVAPSLRSRNSTPGTRTPPNAGAKPPKATTPGFKTKPPAPSFKTKPPAPSRRSASVKRRY